MAEAEGLDAHKRAVTIRTEKLTRVEKLAAK
jgi:histidinol dehydrogenase